MPEAAVLAEPLVRKIPGAVVRLLEGDLTALAVDAIVFYAREDLALGSGFGTAIQVRGGDAIKKELAAIGSIAMGQAVVTGGGNLKAGHIIHACGPKFHEPASEQKLGECVRAALAAAHQAGVQSVAFPPMGAGFYGVPLDLCARAMLETIAAAAAAGGAPAEILICVRDRREFNAFRQRMEAFGTQE